MTEALKIRALDPERLHDRREEDRLIREGAFQEATAGKPWHLTEEANLADRLTIAQARLADVGGHDPKLEQEVASLEKSLAWQRERNAQARQAGTLEGSGKFGFRLDRGYQPVAPELAEKLIQEAYETNFRTAVQREIAENRRKGLHITPNDAAQIVNAKIQSQGFEGLEAFAQYVSLRRRFTGE